VGKWVSTGAYPYNIAEKYMIGYLLFCRIGVAEYDIVAVNSGRILVVGVKKKMERHPVDEFLIFQTLHSGINYF